jgi:hypothetical protein
VVVALRLFLSLASFALFDIAALDTMKLPQNSIHSEQHLSPFSQEISTSTAQCRKLGAVRISGSSRFRCIKTSKGLKWNLVSGSSPSTQPVVVTTTTVDLTPADEVARTIHGLLLAASAREVVSSTKIEYLSEEPIYRTGEDSAKTGVDPALKIYAQLGFEIPKTVIVLFAKTEAGIRSKLRAEGCTASVLNTDFAFLSSTGQALSGSCNGDRVAVVIGPTSSWSQDQLGIAFQHTVPHELFHQWQMNSTSNCGSWRCGNSDFPKWLFEGTPQVMTRIAFWSWNRNRNYADWLENWYTVYSGPQKEMCRGVTIEEMVDPRAPWGRPGGCAYSKGQLAVEVLIAKYGGFEALRSLHTTKTTAGLSGFAGHFQRVTGRTLSEFYAEVNSYFAARNFP